MRYSICLKIIYKMLIFKHKWIYNKQTTSTVYYISYVESQNVTKSLLNNYNTCSFTIS